MSTTIDQRVVEMRFDNKHFEQNVSHTMSTLDKLKQKLRLDGASKGLENIGSSARKVDFSSLGNSVDSVSTRFSAMQVVAVTALANITNSAVNAGKNIVKALTITPITTGLDEYETKMGSIQTILANTEHQGTTMDDVTAALQELNLYADKTIYNFQEMTRNIGTFTAAGVDLDTSVKAIQGIANLAAISGSTSQQASTAMYQLSQALATGTVKLMDWNSVVNAGMGGKVFQNALIRTAAMLDGAAQDVQAWQAENVDAYGSFRDSLTQGAWLTSEVLTETLKQFTMAAEEGTEEWEAYKKSLMEQGYAEAQAEEILKMANTATDAATKVKTFTQLFDTLKESAQSGWAQTWELIFGDFEEAKEFFTGLSDTIGGLINNMSDYRNNLLGGVLDSSWDKLISKINEAGIKTTDFEEKIRELYDNDTELDKLIEQFGSLEKAIKAGKIPADLLKKALASLGINTSEAETKIADFVAGLKEIERILGFGSVGDDVKKLQQALEALGHSVGIHGIDGIIGPDTQKAIMEFQKAAGIAVDGIAGPETIAALEKAGSSVEEIAKGTNTAALEYNELIDSITEKGGRELFLEGFSNVIKGLIGTFKALGAAWSEIFPADGIHTGLVKAIEAFNSFSKSLLVTEEVLDKNGNVITKFNEKGESLVRVFKGVFAAVDILLIVLGGPLKIAFHILSEIIGAFGFNVLDVAAGVGDAIVSFRDWLDSIFDVSGALEVIIPIVEDAINIVKNWFNAFKASEGLQKAVEYINELSTSIKDWWAGLEDAEDLPKTIAEGIVNFLSNIPTIISELFSHIKSAFSESFTDLGDGALSGFIENITSGLSLAGQVIVELGKILLDRVNEFLSANGFKEISADAIAGLVSGFEEGAVNAWNAAVEMVKTLVQKVKDFLGIHSPSTVMIAIGGFIIAGLIKGITDGFPELWGSVSDIGTGLFDMLTSMFSNVVSWISQIDFGTLFVGGISIGLIAVINKIANALSVFEGLGDLLEETGDAIKNLGKAVKNLSFGAKMWALSKVITSIAIAIGVLAGSLFLLSFVDGKALRNAVIAIAVLAAVMGGLAVVVRKFGPSEAADLGKYALALLGLAGSILVMAAAVKVLSGVENINQAAIALLGIVVAMSLLMKATQVIGPNASKIGATLLSVAGAMLIMVYVAKIAGEMDRGQLIQGGLAVVAFGGIIVGLMAATKLISGSKNVGAIGGSLLKIAGAMLIMVYVAKIAGSMNRAELIQGGLAIIAFGGIIVGLMAATKLINGSKNVGAIGGSLFKIAAAILIMVVVAKIAAGMSVEEMDKGIRAIAAFSGIIITLMAATKLINGSKNIDKIGGTLLAMAAAIAIMAVVVTLLGFLDVAHLAKGIVAVGLLGTLLSLMIHSTKGATECKSNIMAMSIAIGVMAAAVILLSFIPIDKLASATIALSAVMGMFALVVKQSKNLNAAIGPLIVMTGALALIAGALYLLATMPVENVIGSAIALSAVLLALAGAMKIVSTMPNNINIGALVTLAAMIAAMYAVIGALAIMQNVDNAVENALVLGGLITVLSAMCVVIAAAGAIISATGSMALLGLGMLAGIVIAMYAVIGALAIMQNIENAKQNALVLGGLMTVLSVLCVVIAAAGAIVAATAGVALVGLGFLVGIIATLYLIIGALAIMQNIEDAEANTNLLIRLLSVMSELMVLLAVVGPFAAIGVAALTALSGLMVAFGILATAIGALVTKFPQIQEFLDTGIPIFEQLASGLGSVIGNFVAGFAGAVMTILPQLGMCLSMFMMNVTPFIEGAKTIDGSVLTGVGILTAAIIALSVAEFINGVANMFSLSSGLAQLGTDLSDFISNAKPFIEGASAITEDTVSGVKALAETILILTGANIIEGLTSFLTGGSSLDNFASQLPVLGAGLADFASSIGTFTEEQLTTVNCAAKAIKTLAQASSEIPNTGGLLAQIVGDNDLSTFASSFPTLGTGLADFLTNVGTFSEEQVTTVNCAAKAIKLLAQVSAEIPNAGGLLGQIVGENDLSTFASSFPMLGTALSNFLTNIGTFTEEQVTTVDCAASAIKSLAQASSEIPNTGGLLAQIVGDNDLSTFAGSFPLLGTGLADFLTNIGTFTDAQVTTVNCAANAIQALAAASAAIPNTGGLLAQIVGDNDLSTFSTQLPALGTALNGFVTNLGTFTEEQVSTVRSGVSAINALAGLANADLEGATDNLSDFGDDLPDFASNIASFCTSMPDSSSVTSAVDTLHEILAAVEDIGDANSGALSTFADNLKEVGEDAVSKFVSAFTSNAVKADLKDAAKTLCDKVIDGIEAKESAIKDAGKDLMKELISGIEAKESAVETAGKDAAEQAVDGAEAQKSSMEGAGNDLGDGLVIGINAKKGAAYQAGYALGLAALQGEKDAQDSNSPAKETIALGHDFGEGSVIGITDKNDDVYDAGYGLGDTAVNALSSGFTGVKDIASGAVDAISNGLSAASGYLGFGNLVDNANSNLAAYSNAAGQYNAVTEEFVETEASYWEALLETKRAGAEAEKYESMELLEFQEDILAQTSDVYDKYLSEVDRKRSSLMDSTGIFSEVNDSVNVGDIFSEVSEQKDVTAEALTKNLSDRVEQMQEYTDIMASLNARIVNEDLLATINEMGVSSLAELRALNSMTEEELSAYVGLFEQNYSLLQEDITAETLTKNLSDQVEQMREFTDIMASLNGRISNEDLLSEINEMGVSSLEELRALNSMTEEELSAYVDLYEEKYELCNEAALTQLESLREETEAQISDILGGVDVDLSSFETVFDGTFESLNNYVSTVLSSGMSEAGAEAGAELVAGFAEGITENTFEAEAAAAAMAAAAAEAAREELDINSPSKVFAKMGTFIPAGLAQGIDKTAKLAARSMTNMVDNAVGGARGAIGDLASVIRRGINGAFDTPIATNALSTTISRIADMVNDNIDAQPTIRPVLDLSNVRSGANAINSLFGQGTSVGLLANVNGINSAMNRRNQNGVNGDVVSAIDKLSRKMDNINNASYTINGITYDDGSNVANAIETLVRATIRERRV